MRLNKSLRRAGALALAVVPVVSAQQFSLQHANHFSVSADFNGTSLNGTNPLGVAFDGSNIYVSGFNGLGTAGFAGIVKYSGAIDGTTISSTAFASSQISTAAISGITQLAYDRAGDRLYAGYDSNVASTSTVTQYQSDGTQGWQVVGPAVNAGSAIRPWALAIDPVGDAGSPLVALFNQGSGRRLGLKTSDGSVLYATNASPTAGGIINGSPVFTGTAWRAAAFDAAGNIALSDDNSVIYGLRVNANQWSTIDGATLNATSSSVRIDVADNRVGRGVTILSGVGPNNLLAFAPRAGTPFAVTLTDLNGGTTSADARNLQIRNVDGTTTGLTQTALTGGEDGIGNAWSDSLRNVAFGLDANNQPVMVVVNYAERTVDTYTLEPEWTGSGGGTWDNTGNWLGGLRPDSALQNAKFGGAGTPGSVLLNDARTTKNLKFDNLTSYTIGGSGTLTVSAPEGLAGQIQVLSGSHNVNVPITLAKDLNVTVNGSGNVLNLSGDIAAAGKGVTKRGDGTAVVKNLRASALAVRGGTLKTAPNGTSTGTSRTATLTIEGDTDAWTATYDLTDNALAVDYLNGGPSPKADIANQLKSGYAGGAWNGTGIISSTAASTSAPARAALGYAEASQLSSIPTIFSAIISDAETVFVMYTLAGDATFDRKVDTQDFNQLAGSFGLSGQDWVSGDFNYDGTVDSTDFDALVGNFGASMPFAAPALGASVPEPAALGLSALILPLLSRRRRIG